MAASSPPSEALSRPWSRSESAGAVALRDCVGQFVEAALLGGEDHGFYVAEGDAVAGEGLGCCGRRQQQVLRLGYAFAQDDTSY